MCREEQEPGEELFCLGAVVDIGGNKVVARPPLVYGDRSDDGAVFIENYVHLQYCLVCLIIRTINVRFK